MPVLLDVTEPERSARALGAELAPVTHSLAERLADTAVIDIASCDQAVLDREQLRDAITRVNNFFEPYKKMAFALHKALCDGQNDIIKPLQALDQLKRDAITRFNAEQQRRRWEREQALAEDQRREQEARAASEAAALEARGEPALAAAVVDEAISAPAPVVVLPNDLAHVRFRRRWCWKFSGGPAEIKRTPADVLKRALDGMPREFLCIDEAKIGGYVRSMKASGKIPGIDIYAVDDPIR